MFKTETYLSASFSRPLSLQAAVMELKLVYRILRKISDWTVEGYYSETYIEGQENVPGDGPLIM